MIDDEHTYCRDHVSVSGQDGPDAWVAQEERNRHGIVTLLAPVVRSMEMEFFPGVDASRARKAGIDLLRAAGLLEEITGEAPAGEFSPQQAQRVLDRLAEVSADIERFARRRGTCQECGAEDVLLEPAEVSADDGIDRRKLWRCVDGRACWLRLEEGQR